MAEGKRRKRGEGGVYQRASDGMWVGALNLGYRDGKRRRRLVYGRTQKIALQKLNEAKRALEDYGDIPTADTTLEKWVTTWLDDMARRKVKPRTLQTYRSHLEQHVLPVIGKKKLGKLQPSDVRSVHRHVERKGLSSTTALHAHRVLHTALQAAMREQLIMRNVASLVDAPSKTQHERKGLSAEQARRVLKVARDDRLYSRWLAAFLTGARQGELLGVRWRYVDLDAGTIDLAWSLQRVPYSHGCGEDKPTHKADRCPKRFLDIPAGMKHEILDGNLCLLTPKTKGSTRVVPLAEPLRRALEARQLGVDLERDGYTVDHDLVWCRADGRPLDGRQDWHRWKSLLDAAGVPSVTLHETRNTTATLLHEAGVDDGTAAQILGHSSVTMTRAYQHRDLGFARDAVAKLGDALSLD